MVHKTISTNTLPEREGVLLFLLGWIRGSTKAFVGGKELAYQSSVDEMNNLVLSSDIWRKVVGSDFSYTDTSANTNRDFTMEQTLNIPTTDILSAVYFRTRLTCHANCTYRCGLYESRYVDFKIYTYTGFTYSYGYNGDLSYMIMKVNNVGNDTDPHTINIVTKSLSRPFRLAYVSHNNDDESIASLTFDLGLSAGGSDSVTFNVSNGTIPVKLTYKRIGNYIDSGTITVNGYIECTDAAVIS